ncbi:MAG TPA: class I SAM-dependent methyltransferase, partial [Candidatus Dormibacteraeota bacterium]|nr:class I SAM-dependent methyltransferase [Candidatus Dormibacteraeota bacterium]
MAPLTDQWSAWILERRFGGGERRARAMLEELGRVRDQILDYAELKTGDRLLDVGCGDGLIGFGALAREPGCSVVFSDVSERLVDQCRQLASVAGVTERGRFLDAAAEDLSQMDDASIDVVTTRSVLIFVEAKLRAFQEFYRVLR